MANPKDNLIPQSHVLTVEEQSAGGKASAEVRKQKASFKNAVKWLLESDMPIGEGDIKNKFLQNGIDINQFTPAQLGVMGCYLGAVCGNATNLKTLYEISEENNTTAFDTPMVEIKVIDNSNLEKIMYEENRHNKDDNGQ